MSTTSNNAAPSRAISIHPLLAIACLLAAAAIGALAMRSTTGAHATAVDPVRDATAQAMPPATPTLQDRATPPPPRMADPGTSKRLAEMSQARFESAAQLYAGQPRGQAGSQQMSQRILESAGDSPLLAQAGVTPGALDIECRGPTCRIDARFPTRSMAEDWIGLLPLAMANELQQIEYSVAAQPDGTTQVVIYGGKAPNAQPAIAGATPAHEGNR